MKHLGVLFLCTRGSSALRLSCPSARIVRFYCNSLQPERSKIDSCTLITVGLSRFSQLTLPLITSLSHGLIPRHPLIYCSGSPFVLFFQSSLSLMLFWIKLFVFLLLCISTVSISSLLLQCPSFSTSSAMTCTSLFNPMGFLFFSLLVRSGLLCSLRWAGPDCD